MTGGVGLPEPNWLSIAIRLGASDLHLSVAHRPYMRLDGRICPMSDEVLTVDDVNVWGIALLGERGWKCARERNETDAASEWNGSTRIRVHTFHKGAGEMAISVRILPTCIPTPESIGIPQSVLQLSERMHGLLVVAGPTGAGKTTTVAALVHHLNTHYALRIITLEDPIEYRHIPWRSMIEQREVGCDTTGFDRGLYAALRQDPDCLVVGELRDRETMHTAIRAAETGRLVLATMHAADTVSAVYRLIDAFPADQQSYVRMQLSEQLAGVVAQRLLPRGEEGGRVAAFEVLINTPAAANLIRSGQLHQLPSLMQVGTAWGMQTFEQEMDRLLQMGAIDSGAVKSWM
jgi:twitching motility protein PilT